MRFRLAVAVAPIWVWGAVISALPHKEERFLYPVYPLVSNLPRSVILNCPSIMLDLGLVVDPQSGCLIVKSRVLISC